MLFPYFNSGCLEAGCGCLAGAVFAAASVLAKTHRDEYMMRYFLPTNGKTIKVTLPKNTAMQ